MVPPSDSVICQYVELSTRNKTAFVGDIQPVIELASVWVVAPNPRKSIVPPADGS
jgi:hypothetical protein